MLCPGQRESSPGGRRFENEYFKNRMYFLMKENKKNGRPKIEAIRQKSRIVSTRLTADELILVTQRAEQAGVKLSRYAREMLLKGKIVQRITPEDAKTLRLLANEANNINQLAHKANAEGYEPMMNVNAYLAVKINDIIKRLSDDWKNNKRR